MTIGSEAKEKSSTLLIRTEPPNEKSKKIPTFALRSMTVEINNVPFTLLHEKAIYKNDEQLLIIADIHLGKASHFRKEGIPIPAHAQQADYENLARLLLKVKPVKVYFLGDLFHSTFNRDWHYFCDLIAQFPHIKFILIRGNHDLIDDALFRDICVDVVETIEDSAFVYSHEPVPTPARKVNITGHIHPGYVLSGMGRQSVKLPCFYITPCAVVLPAFGALTGLYTMERTRHSSVYIVVSDGVRQVV